MGLIRHTGDVLLDAGSTASRPRDSIQATSKGERIANLRVWQVGPGHHATIVSSNKSSEDFKVWLADLHLSHLTVEIGRLP